MKEKRKAGTSAINEAFSAIREEADRKTETKDLP